MPKSDSAARTVFISLCTFLATALLAWLGSTVADPAYLLVKLGGVSRAEYVALEERLKKLEQSTIPRAEYLALEERITKLQKATIQEGASVRLVSELGKDRALQVTETEHQAMASQIKNGERGQHWVISRSPLR